MSMSLNNDNTTTTNSNNQLPTSPHRAYGRPLASRSRSLLVFSELLQPEVEIEPTLRVSGGYVTTTTNSFANAVPTVHRTTTTTTAPSSESSLSSSSSFPRINEARKQRRKEDPTFPPSRKLALVSDDLEPPSFDEEHSSYMYSRASGSLLRTSEVDQWEALPEILRVEDDDEGAGTERGGSGYKKDKGKNRAVDGFSKSFSSRHSGKPSDRDVPRPRPLPLPSSSSYASSSSRRQHDNSSYHYEARSSFNYNVDSTQLSAPDQSMFESSRTISRSTPRIRPGNIGPEAEAAEPEAPNTPAISVLPIPAFKGFHRQQQQQPTDSSSIRTSPPFPPTPKSMTTPMPIRVSTPVVGPSVVPASLSNRARSNSSVTFMGSDRGLGLRAASSSSFRMARSSSSMSVPQAPRSNFKPISGVGERARAASVASVSSTPFTSASRPESRFSSRNGSGDVPKTVFMSAASARPPTSESAAFFWNKNPNNSESSTNSSSDLPSSTNDTDTDIEPNEAWKAKLRENIERRVTKMKAQKRASHATFMQGIVNEEDRRRFRWEYEQSLSRPRKEFNIEAWAQYQFQTELDRERERRRVRILGEHMRRGIGGKGEVQYKRWIPVSTSRSA